MVGHPLCDRSSALGIPSPSLSFACGSVTGITPLRALTTVHEQPGAVEAFQFSLLEAAASTGITVAIGLPLAWGIWPLSMAKRLRLKRALLFLPFVTPPVVAAVGFLALISPDGFLYNLGFDLRGETGLIGWLSSVTGWSHPGHFIALVGAHVWFNLSLMIRFVEPVVAQLDSTVGGTTRPFFPRVKHEGASAFSICGGQCSGPQRWWRQPTPFSSASRPLHWSNG